MYQCLKAPVSSPQKTAYPPKDRWGAQDLEDRRRGDASEIPCVRAEASDLE
jgi:hypothetical protein